MGHLQLSWTAPFYERREFLGGWTKREDKKERVGVVDAVKANLRVKKENLTKYEHCSKLKKSLHLNLIVRMFFWRKQVCVCSLKNQNLNKIKKNGFFKSSICFELTFNHKRTAVSRVGEKRFFFLHLDIKLKFQLKWPIHNVGGRGVIQRKKNKNLLSSKLSVPCFY